MFKNICKYTWVLWIILISLGIVTLIIGVDWNVLLADDNILQWEPVMRNSFDYLFEHGRLPYIDFYQFNKMNTLDVGYYGLLNPFIFLAYCISRFLLHFLVGILPIYIVLLVVLGNLFLYQVLRKLKISAALALLGAGIYTCSVPFWLWSYYYFSFNNYFFIPFFVYVLLSFNRTKYCYVLLGLCLGFSLLLGHAQYTVYYYVAYTLICWILWVITRQRKTLLMWLTNVITGLLVSMPFLYLLAEGGARRALNHGNNGTFFFFLHSIKSISFYMQSLIVNLAAIRDTTNILFAHYFNYPYNGPIVALFMMAIYWMVSHMLKNIEVEKLVSKPVHILACAILTFAIVARLCWGGYYIVVPDLLSILVMVCWPRLVKHIPWCLLLLIIVSPELYVYFCVLIAYQYYAKIHKIDSCLFLSVLSVTAVFFIMLVSGRDTMVGQTLALLPVFSQFRYLYKVIFLIIPLISICALASVRWIPTKYHKWIVLVLIGGIVGNIYVIKRVMLPRHPYIGNKIFHYNIYPLQGYADTVQKQRKLLAFDLENYRVLPFLDSYGNSYIEESSYWMMELFTKNFATYVNIFSPGGYDDCYSKGAFDQHFYLYGYADFKCLGIQTSDSNLLRLKELALHTQYAMENLVAKENWMLIAEEPCQRDLFFAQMSDNAVKYLLISAKNEEWVAPFEQWLKTDSPYPLKRKVKGAYNTWWFELDGVPSLVTSAQRNFIALTSNLATLEFDKIKGEDKIRLSFDYDSHYKAQLCEETHCETVLVEPDDKHYTWLSFTEAQQQKNGHVTVTYQYWVADVAVVFALLNIILLIICWGSAYAETKR